MSENPADENYEGNLEAGLQVAADSGGGGGGVPTRTDTPEQPKATEPINMPSRLFAAINLLDLFTFSTSHYKNVHVFFPQNHSCL